MRILFHHSLAVGLGLHFFITYLLVYTIAIEKADTMFSRLVIEIKLLVAISIFKSPWKCSRIFTKTVDHIFLSVFFILYLFLQQLLIEVILLNKVHCMAGWSESKTNSGLIVQSDGIAH